MKSFSRRESDSYQRAATLLPACLSFDRDPLLGNTYWPDPGDSRDSEDLPDKLKKKKNLLFIESSSLYSSISFQLLLVTDILWCARQGCPH